MKKSTWQTIICGCILSILTVQHSNVYSLSSLQEVAYSNAKVEKLSGGFKFIEGPVWDRRGFLLFSDISANTIYKWTPNGQTSIFRYPAGRANGNTLDLEGRLITAEQDRRLVRTEQNNTLTVLTERYGGKQLNSPNDVVVKSDGSIYFTDPPYGISKEKEELGFYGVYRRSPNGTLILLTNEMVRPNGLAFSPDEKKLYVSDSENGHIRVFQVNSDGKLSEGRVFAQLKGPENKGVPDGMKVDVQGNVYCSGLGGLWVLSPTGQLLGKIIVPEVVTNLAWGDKDYKSLYITATGSLYRIRLNVAGVQPGKSGLP
ncbi:SMP-30/gluconolactonase/LRE family protein [Chlorogloea sp. CCALA 695]|uniref:SMP-30/gluconolactonase/LRE family protein n=1 Tax=Chlorogloea sp. CCALA 695 TaxID=2107693 RepID=UPI001E5E5A49|nr:SMP-30/gluconolactonase/LRE family protein [Chlorogloea sp. CCALA 695]